MKGEQLPGWTATIGLQDKQRLWDSSAVDGPGITSSYAHY